MAIATYSVSDDGKTATLTSSSFDPGGAIASQKWEVVTEAYSWLGFSDYLAAETTFAIPSATLAARYGNSIEFKLTVTDDGTPILTDSTTVTFNLNQGPTADIAVSAMLADPANPDVANYDDNGNGVKDENAERYPLDGVIDGPGENGNADNEWDIAEGALITLDGSGSSDPGGQLPASGHDWTLVYISGDTSYDGTPSTSLPGDKADAKKISTDEDDTTAVTDGTEVMTALKSAGDTGRPAPDFFAYYRLTVTDSGGAFNAAIVKLVVHDQPANPRIDSIVPTANTAVAPGSKISEETVPPGSGKYVIAPNSAVTLTITDSPFDGADTDPYSDPDGGPVTVSWEGAQSTNPRETPANTKASFAAPSTAEEGDEFTITATAADITGRTGTKSVVLVVATNTKPEAIANGVKENPDIAAKAGSGYALFGVYTHDPGGNGFKTIVVSDGPDGGDVNPATGKGTGVVKLRGIGFDADGDPLIFNWTELAFKPTDAGILNLAPALPPYANPNAVKLPQKAVLTIDDAFSETASFKVPEVSARHIVDQDGNLAVPIAFTVIDKWGVKSTEVVVVIIVDDDDVPVADAGPNQAVTSGSFVRLNGSGSSDSDPGDKLSYQWTYIGIVTDPATQDRGDITAAEKDYGYVECEWFPYSDDTDRKKPDGTNDECDDGKPVGTYHATAGGALKNANTAYPYFDAPQVGKFDSIKLKFSLVVTDGQATAGDQSDDNASAKASMVTITITDGFYGGQITGPDFCLHRSLGGPITYAYDSDGDGVAETCSLNTTRRATIARQNALETLAALNPETFKDHLHGRDAAAADPDATPPKPAVTKIASQCALAPKTLGDSAAALAADSCGNGKNEVSKPPPPTDPAKADVFFSGGIDGPSYCADASLGGPPTYANDTDGDDIADICSLSFTRREAIARQNALNKAFSGHAQYKSALAAACTALGTSDFGDKPADLAKDDCDRPPAVATGTPLPKPPSS